MCGSAANASSGWPPCSCCSACFSFLVLWMRTRSSCTKKQTDKVGERHREEATHRHVRKLAHDGQHKKHRNPHKKNDNAAPLNPNQSTAMYIETRPERRTCAKVLSCCKCFLARVPAALLFASKNLVASLSTAATQLRNWKTRG